MRFCAADLTDWIILRPICKPIFSILLKNFKNNIQYDFNTYNIHVALKQIKYFKIIDVFNVKVLTGRSMIVFWICSQDFF